jgi:hypothetical protein
MLMYLVRMGYKFLRVIGVNIDDQKPFGFA